MSTNTIRAHLSFSFKGETYTLDSIIDLDRFLGKSDGIPDFHRLLAQSAGIDPYSYLYEVLESHAIGFSDATGVAARCCEHGSFDWPRFVRVASEERDWLMARAAAEPFVGVSDWETKPELRAALLAAYRAGRAAAA